jgi:hypothetical protein
LQALNALFRVVAVPNAPHAWQPDTLARDLIPAVAFNCRLGDGQLARVYAFAGRWHILREDGTSVDGLTLTATCRWLNERGARPLGKREGG